MINASLCSDPIAWDHYVHTNSDAYSYHRWMWADVIRSGFRHEPYYISASCGNRIVGVLPLVAVKSRFFGNSLVSVPFFTYGGPLADSRAAEACLLEKAIEIAAKLNVRHVELRNGRRMDCKWEETASKVTMKVPLPAKADDLWKQISTGLRNKIRKAQKSGFRIEWGGIGEVNRFYPVFASNMRNLGTPVYPRKWFEAIARGACEQLRIVSVLEENRAVASAILLAYRDELELPWSASLPESRKQYSHLLLYWTFLEWAIQNGFRSVDLGRCTPGSGTYEFKRHWGCEEQILHWYHWAPPGKSVSQLRPESAKFHLATRIWQHLPLAVTNHLGPIIVRGLP